MSCYHPLTAVVTGLKDNGKRSIKVISEQSKNFGEFDGKEFINVPCGHCIGCYLDRARQWADRCMLESQYHEKNCFITLTYNDKNLPAKLCDEDGVVSDSPYYPLCKRDFQLFMKNLRERIEPVKIRFFACGEYGGQTYRPHYHAIIFGYDFSDDRKLYKKNFNNQNYYTSELLDDIWKKGFTTVCDLDWQCANYVARYCLKKRNNDIKDFLEENHLTDEFTLMSRKPGIARQYYEDHKNDIYRTEEIIISDHNGSKKLRPPSYYDKLYDIDYPSDMERIKEKRSIFMINQMNMIMEKTSLRNYNEYLKVKEYNHLKATEILKEKRCTI